MATVISTQQHTLDEITRSTTEPLFRISSAGRRLSTSKRPETKIHIQPIDIEIGQTELISSRDTQEALEVVSKGKYQFTRFRAYPEIKSDDEVVIRNRAVGLNPIDWKSVDYNFCLPAFPWVTGRECAGVVEKVGKGVSKFKVGDKVWTSTYYRDVRAGCFQELVTVPQHTVCKIPDNIDYTTAAMLGVGPLTAAMTLWKWLDVPVHPVVRGSSEYILIWGGSTVTGQIAIQLCVQSGLTVIAVASNRTASLVSGLGATHVVCRDGKTDDEIVSEIIALGENKITRGLDLVGGKTAALGLKVMSTDKPCLFVPLAMMSSSQAVPEGVKVLNVEMKQFVLDKSNAKYAERLNYMVKNGQIRLPEKEVIFGGLSKVEEGLERLKRGDMAGKKLVVAL